ncbi:MAG: VTT domain-containing protein [Patescibacteria group bacterium]
MFLATENFIRQLAEILPVELFVFLGSIIEEVIAPIPSPLVTMMAGVLVFSAGKTFLTLIVLAIIGGLSKTLICWLFYILGDKTEDYLLKKFGRWLGVSHTEIEGLGKYFNGTKRDVWALLFIRALPFMPTTIVSLFSGIIKIKMENYLLATSIGLTIRSFIFLVIGYTGFASLESIINGIGSIESALQIIIALILISVLAYFYWQRKVKHKI